MVMGYVGNGGGFAFAGVAEGEADVFQFFCRLLQIEEVRADGAVSFSYGGTVCQFL